jgi:hypothetical protein
MGRRRFLADPDLAFQQWSWIASIIDSIVVMPVASEFEEWKDHVVFLPFA